VKVIDRYVLWEFFRNFLFSLLFFTILILVIRFSEKEMGKYVSRNMSFSSSIFSLMLQIPDYIVRVAPPSALFATFFSLGRMAQNNEITAMKAAGISLYRVFYPVFIAALLIALFMIVFNDQVATRTRRKESEISGSYTKLSEYPRHVIFESSGNRVIYISLMFLRNRNMQDVTIYEFDDNNNVKRETFAKRVFWSDETWQLSDVIVRNFNDEGGWDETTYDHKDIIVPEDPEIMAKGTRGLKEMSLSELSKLVKYKKAAGRVVRKDLVVFHDKISFPFACFIMAILGAPLFVVFGKSGTAVGFLLTMFISFLYWGIAIAVFEAFGNNGKLPPMLSCWLANFIFAAVGGVFIFKVKK